MTTDFDLPSSLAAFGKKVMSSSCVVTIGRFQLALRLDADTGRVSAIWQPKNPVRLTDHELAAFREARRAFFVAHGLEPDAPPAPDRRAQKRAEIVGQLADRKAAATAAWPKAAR